MSKRDEKGYCYTRLADPSMSLDALDALDVMCRNVDTQHLLQWARTHDLLLNHTTMRAMIYPSPDPDNQEGLAAHLQDRVNEEDGTLTFQELLEDIIYLGGDTVGQHEEPGVPLDLTRFGIEPNPGPVTLLVTADEDEPPPLKKEKP